MAFFKRHGEPDAVPEAPDQLRPGATFPSMDLFLARRPQRRDAQQIEYGIMWREGERKRPRYRVAWLEETGELIAEALSEFEHLRTIELLGTVTSRETLDLALTGWERLSYAETTLEWVRTQISMRTPGGGVVAATEAVDAVATPRLERIRRSA